MSGMQVSDNSMMVNDKQGFSPGQFVQNPYGAPLQAPSTNIQSPQYGAPMAMQPGMMQPGMIQPVM